MKRRLSRSLSAAVLALVLGACSSGQPEREKKPTVATLYELDLRDAFSEQASAMLGEERPGLSDAVLKVRALLDEPLAKGLFVRLGELHGRFGDLREWADTFAANPSRPGPLDRPPGCGGCASGIRSRRRQLLRPSSCWR